MNCCEFLSEKVFFLLLGEGFVNDRGNLVADLGDGGEFDKQLGNDFEPCLGVGRGQDLCARGVVSNEPFQVRRLEGGGLTKLVIELGVDG